MKIVKTALEMFQQVVLLPGEPAEFPLGLVADPAEQPVAYLIPSSAQAAIRSHSQDYARVEMSIPIEEAAQNASNLLEHVIGSALTASSLAEFAVQARRGYRNFRETVFLQLADKRWLCATGDSLVMPTCGDKCGLSVLDVRCLTVLPSVVTKEEVDRLTLSVNQ